MIDILEIITATSRIFQTRNLLRTEVSNIITETQMSICCPKTSIGAKMISFWSSDQSRLTGPAQAEIYKDHSDVKLMTSSIDTYIDKRFINFKKETLCFFDVLDYRLWPTDSEQLISAMA
jgi:hypothetical protein